MNYLKLRSWPPKVAGLLIAILYFSTWILFEKLPGTSTTFVRLAAALENIFSKTYVFESAYFNQYFVNYSSLINWFSLFVVGIFFGSFISSKLSGDFKKEYVPELWKLNFGNSILLRAIFAFIGGAIMLFGARLAGGCTSGKAIAEGILLKYTGLVFMCALFAGGILTAFILYRRK